MTELDAYIQSRIGDYPNNWSRSQWQRSFDAWNWFITGGKGKNPFIRGLYHDGITLDGDTPAPALGTSVTQMDWFTMQDWMWEVQLHVDFEPAPELQTVRAAYNASYGEGWLYSTILAGEAQDTYDVSLEALYVHRGSRHLGKLESIFGRETNDIGMMGKEYIGWEWFSGVW